MPCDGKWVDWLWSVLGELAGSVQVAIHSHTLTLQGIPLVDLDIYMIYSLFALLLA